MITTIMFDLDGVLVDAREWHFRALNKALLDISGTEITTEEHLSKFDGLPTRNKLNLLECAGRVRRESFDAIFRLKQHYTLMMIRDYCRPDPVKVEMMNGLHDYRKACVTNSIAKTAYEMLVMSGLNYYMDYVQGNEATKYPKPSPAPYLNAMAVMGVDPENVLVVEDSPHGIKSAYKSGARVLEVQYETLNLSKIMEALK